MSSSLKLFEDETKMIKERRAKRAALMDEATGNVEHRKMIGLQRIAEALEGIEDYLRRKNGE